MSIAGDGVEAIEACPKDALRKIAEAAGVPVGQLLVLSPQNDPFNAGSPTQWAVARWFLSLFESLSIPNGLHIRRIFYRAVHVLGIQTHDGRAFENTSECWEYIQSAAKQARYLGLVDPDAIIDQRNPPPKIFAGAVREIPEPDWETMPFDEFCFPAIRADLYYSFDKPEAQVGGYDYLPADQRVHLELWIEKSTMNDVLAPICKKHSVNLVTSIGFQSITGAVNLLSRIKAAAEQKIPIRLLWLSDFDPAGCHMPVAMARQIEFWLQQRGLEADLAIDTLVLTAEQVEEYSLPRIPIKASDRRKQSFEDQCGAGAVELDALEAIHPGVLAEIVQEAILQYRDPTLQKRLMKAERAAGKQVEKRWNAFTVEIDPMLKELTKQTAAVVKKFEPKVAKLQAEFEAHIQPIRAKAEIARTAIMQAIDSAEHLDIELPDRPEPDTDSPDESSWLFSSGRTFLEQTAVYKSRKAGGDIND